MTFIQWLDEELNKKNWSRSDLARKAGISTASLSLIYSGKRNPGHELCINIAGAFDIPQVVVLEKAGLLSDPEEQNEIIQKTLYDMGYLPIEDQEEIMEFVRLKRTLHERREKYKK